MLRISLPMERHLMPAALSCRIAIIGGGYSGATIARLLALSGQWHEQEIVVFEPRARLGAGLAYDTDDTALRLNVPAARMRAIPNEPTAFLDWLKSSGALADDPDAVTADGAVYARRLDFAGFMAERMAPLLESGMVRHVRERVENVLRTDGGWRVTGDCGTRVMADMVVIATSHPKPNAPGMIALALKGHPRFIAEPSQAGAFDPIGTKDRVFIIGAGLTALDVVTSLRNRGHLGDILAFSRSGLVPQQQPGGAPAAHGNFLSPPCRSALSLLRAVRAAICEAEQLGLPWQSVFDVLRQQGQSIWRSLPPAEQRRFLRHLRRRYETHRYRMPPQIAAIMRQDLADERLKVRAGRICRVERGTKSVDIDLILKPEGVVERQAFEWVVAATGPDHAAVISSHPYLADLQRAGCIRPDQHRLGIACDTESRAIGLGGRASDTLFIAGPLARGTFGELTGVPEIAAQAEHIATRITAGVTHGRLKIRHS